MPVAILLLSLGFFISWLLGGWLGRTAAFIVLAPVLGLAGFIVCNSPLPGAPLVSNPTVSAWLGLVGGMLVAWFVAKVPGIIAQNRARDANR